MKVFAFLLVLLLGGVGCARIYRPVAVVASPARTPGPQLSGHAEPQPWGDNSRYEERAQTARLKVLALTLENTASGDVEILTVEVPAATEALSPEAALKLVKQWPAAYASYVVVPAVAVALSSGYEGVAYAGLGVVGLLIAIPNAMVASRSNDRLESFFRARAWSPGVLHAGETWRGLLFLRTPEPAPPLSLRIHYRAGGDEHHLDLPGP